MVDYETWTRPLAITVDEQSVKGNRGEMSCGFSTSSECIEAVGREQKGDGEQRDGSGPDNREEQDIFVLSFLM